MIFSKQFLQDEEGETILNEVVDTSRWSVHYRRVFQHDGKFYETFYSVGATDQQDECPYEYEPDEIECAEVFRTEKTVIVYQREGSEAA